MYSTSVSIYADYHRTRLYMLYPKMGITYITHFITCMDTLILELYVIGADCN